MIAVTVVPFAPDHTRQVIVIGVGTDLRGDDGFGATVLHALRARSAVAAHARLAVCDGEPARLADLWTGYRYAVLVDAIRASAERSGFLSRREFSPLPGAAALAEAAGLGAAVRRGRVLGRLPDRVILYAVHGRDFRLGAPLSRPVEAAVPQLVDRISGEILAIASAGTRQDESPAAHRPRRAVRTLQSSVSLGA